MRIADDCAQTLLRIQAITNATDSSLREGGIPRRPSCAGEGRDSILEMVGKSNMAAP